ncbi:exodeoxyribonuclease VII large subunit [Anaeromicropila herbilytica]|uniref:Exodeoxyribonuclease 7 large subunit n=1 Tax=Anaeromicropila herbilytica TaxID=2785025 RepID=A0A7R7EK82_9FIRM|nr:exodeoxyribonuclease VII large subunit [Anaeromicropila herbilytica]BCN30401.1 exodeoxyribonuclease 7 large subunit [Anaeromicropila herbilytica]
MDHVYSVTQINSYIKNMFMRDYALNNIYIKGEVSNCKYHTSGHIYFTLKDDKGQMACVMFAGQRSGLSFRMSEGQSVIVLGSVNVYERDGKYQLYAREILLDGAGILYQKFEKLKSELEEEGLFDAIYKRPIPKYPTKVGIVTAKTGAAIQDIMNISYRRNPYVQLILYPALVQGEGAVSSIVKGINILDEQNLDIIIVGRGGGSIEDLWAFNEEEVARAIFNASTPIISAVGHETDTTIADFVSDLRAPTPSAAAELAIPLFSDIDNLIWNYNSVLNDRMNRKVSLFKHQLDKLSIQLEYANPTYQVRQKRQLLSDMEDKLRNVMQSKLRDKRHQLAIYIEKMNGLSPLQKLNKGYALVVDKENHIVNSIDKVEIKETLTISLTDGDVIAKVTDKKVRKRA